MKAESLVRLPSSTIRVLKEAVVRFFGPEARLYLFGSRVDLSKRGGDIDLLVINSLDPRASFRAKINALARMMSELGEQRIDLVSWNPEEEEEKPLVVREALEHGVPL